MSKGRMYGAWLAAALLSVVGGRVGASDALTDELLRRATWEQVVISPDGESLAVAQRMADQTMVRVLRRSDMQVIAEASRGKGGEIEAMAWLGNTRLIIAAAKVDDPYPVPIEPMQLYLLEVGKMHPQPLPDNFVGVIAGDDHHVLVSECKGSDGKGGCLSQIHRLDIDHLSREGDTIVQGPPGDGEFMADHNGFVRFSWSFDNDGHSTLHVRDEAGNWKLLNESAKSGAHVMPIGITRDNKYAIVRAGRKTGPDVIERYDFATGERSTLLADDHIDPHGTIWSIDQVEPIGAFFGNNKPIPRYWAGAPEDELQWRQSLSAAFPEETVVLTSGSKDGRVAVVRVSSDRDPGSFYLVDRETRKAQLLFHKKPTLDPKLMAGVESFTFKARDGLHLEGFLTVPPGSNGQHLPMIVVPHGGPFTIADEWTFDTDTQILSTHGYAVLRVNFRGSGGYGEYFGTLGFMQWGAAMQDDVTDATHWAIDQGIADPSRICIYGGSYGGYAALMGVIREPHLYQCAAGLAGIYDLNKMYRWGDIYRSNYGMNYLTRVIGRDKAMLASRSPIDNIDKIQVPVLLAHGAQDGRVGVEHAQAMNKAMKRAGKSVTYLEYQYEGHGLANPEHLRDFYTRLLAFFDAQLKPADGKVATTTSP
jgi:dipeptidyl aminopeptidase/acylaminoacyl peptidase